MAAPQVDIASERLQLQLSRVNVEAKLHSAQLGAQRAILTDQRVVIDLQLEELARLEDTYAGQRMQQSMYTAMLADSRAISNQRVLEQQAIADRVAAGAVSGQPPPPIPPDAHQQANSGNYEDERLTQLEEAGFGKNQNSCDVSDTAVHGSVDSCSSPNVTDGETTKSADDGAPPVSLEDYVNALRIDEVTAQTECVVCTDSFRPFQTVALPCGDVWCRGCIIRRYEDATVNEGAWPVRCCRIEMSLESVLHLLPFGLRRRFEMKSTEWADSHRTYCHEPTCSNYIPQAAIRERRALCSLCSRETCAECKGAYHTEPLCPDSATNDDLLEEIARVNNWPKCPGCNHYVEITHGCNHMTSATNARKSGRLVSVLSGKKTASLIEPRKSHNAKVEMMSDALRTNS